MKLSGRYIKHGIEQGVIVIDPFVPENVGANSVDLTLAPELRVYTSKVLDMREAQHTDSIMIPEHGYVLQPGRLYLGMTNEIAGTRRDFVPCVEGRSSVARLGIFVHVTAGFGDVGFVNRWTLEIMAIHPVRIYPNVRICQVYFDSLLDFIGEEFEPQLYQGKYKALSSHPEPSRLWMDFSNKETK